VLVVVGLGGFEVFLEAFIGRRPDHAELFQPLGAPAVHLPGCVGASLFRDPLPKGGRALSVSVGHPGVPDPFDVRLQLRPAAGPVLAFGVDHVEGDPVRDHHRIPGRGKTQQQS
jgi:hypothetical protein